VGCRLVGAGLLALLVGCGSSPVETVSSPSVSPSASLSSSVSSSQTPSISPEDRSQELRDALNAVLNAAGAYDRIVALPDDAIDRVGASLCAPARDTAPKRPQLNVMAGPLMKLFRLTHTQGVFAAVTFLSVYCFQVIDPSGTATGVTGDERSHAELLRDAIASLGFAAVLAEVVRLPDADLDFIGINVCVPASVVAPLDREKSDVIADRLSDVFDLSYVDAVRLTSVVLAVYCPDVIHA